MDRIDVAIAPLRERVLTHRLYESLSEAEHVLRFMEHHVFAVWDFMSLVKELARRLTCVRTPWLPVGDPIERRFINEIVLEEESDLDEAGQPISHFELYLRAMTSAGADTKAIEQFVEAVRAGRRLDEALECAAVSAPIRTFVSGNIDLLGGTDVELAASFAYARELLIPPMFEALVAQLVRSDPARWRVFRFYLSRHVERDGESHGPMARRIVARLCGEDTQRWSEATEAAVRALNTRITLWDEIAEATR